MKLKLFAIFGLCFISASLYAQSYMHYVPYYADGKYGYSDTAGHITIPAQFGFADFFFDNGTALIYNSTADNAATGLINSKGKVIVPAVYQGLEDLNNVYSVWKDSSSMQKVYTITGKALPGTYSRVRLQGNYAFVHSADSSRIYRYDYKLKTVKAVVKLVKRGKFHTAWTPKDKISHFEFEDADGHHQYFDTLGKKLNLLVDQAVSDLNEDLDVQGWGNVEAGRGSDISSAMYQKNGKYGLISVHFMTPSDTFPAIYNQLTPLTYNDSAVYAARIGRRWGMVNGINKVLLPFEYDTIVKRHSDNEAVAYIKQGKYWGLADITVHKVLLPCRYDAISSSFSEYYYELTLNGEKGICLIYSETVQKMLTPRFRKIHDRHDIRFDKNNDYYELLLVTNRNGIKTWVNWNGFEYCKP